MIAAATDRPTEATASSSANNSTSTPSPCEPEPVYPASRHVADVVAFYLRVVSGEVVMPEPYSGKKYRLATPEERAAFESNGLPGTKRQDIERSAMQAIQMHLNEAQMWWNRSDVPPRYFHADLDDLGDVPQEYQRVADELRATWDSPGIYALVGTRGPGKTHLACALCRWYAAHRKRPRYTTALDIFRNIRATWGKRGEDGDESAVIADLEAVDLLVVDEVQVRSESPWENQILTALVDRRYAYLRTTILIANLEPKALGESVGESIASRLMETGKVFKCTWPTFRTPGRPRPPQPDVHPSGKPVYPPIVPALADLINGASNYALNRPRFTDR